MDKDKSKEILAQLGELTLNREELVRQVQNLEQRANRLKLQLFILDSKKDKSNG